MKKYMLIAGIVSAFLLTGCVNRDFLSWQYNFTWAQVKLPDGSIVEGPVDSWSRGDENDRVRVTIEGIDYNTHFSNVCLFSERPAD